MFPFGVLYPTINFSEFKIHTTHSENIPFHRHELHSPAGLPSHGSDFYVFASHLIIENHSLYPKALQLLARSSKFSKQARQQSLTFALLEFLHVQIVKYQTLFPLLAQDAFLRKASFQASMPCSNCLEHEPGSNLIFDTAIFQQHSSHHANLIKISAFHHTCQTNQKLCLSRIHIFLQTENWRTDSRGTVSIMPMYNQHDLHIYKQHDHLLHLHATVQLPVYIYLCIFIR